MEVSNGMRYVTAQADAGNNSLDATSIRFYSSPRDFVKFVITWENGSGGVYAGSVDANGFVTGTTVDRFDPQSRAYWHMRDLATCAG